MENYRCVTSVQEIQQYISNAAVVAFDYETAPDEPYRIEEKAALDPAKSHIVGCSFSAKEHTGIYVPVAHKIGRNMDGIAFFRFLQKISKKRLTKRRFFRIIAHVERLTPQGRPRLMGICIVVVR